MFNVISPDRRSQFPEAIDGMHRLRHRVFCDRLGWVPSDGEREVDAFDDEGPTYIVYDDPVVGILACVRLLPSVGPNMMRDTFPQVLGGRAVPASAGILESSRFSVDTRHPRVKEIGGRGFLTTGLFYTMIAHGMAVNATGIMTVTDTKIQRIVKRSGWSTISLSPCSVDVGGVETVAIMGEVSHAALAALRSPEIVALLPDFLIEATCDREKRNA